MKLKVKKWKPPKQMKSLKQDKQPKADSLLSFVKFYNDGIFEVENSRFSISLELRDINYQLSSEDAKYFIFSKYCEFLNSLGSNTQIQVFLQKKKIPVQNFQDLIFYEKQNNNFDVYIEEMNNMISEKVLQEKNGFEKKIIFNFIQTHENRIHAKRDLEQLATRFESYARKIGSKVEILGTKERHELLANMFYSKNDEDRDKIIPKELNFKENKKHIKFDDQFAKVLTFNEYPAEMSDNFINDLMSIPREFSFTLNITPFEQDEAFDLVKTKLAFMEQQKVDEQSKALKNGYDYEMIPYELSYSLTEAKELLDDLQNKGQKLFSCTALLYIMQATTEKLTAVEDEVMSVARRYGFKCKALDYLQRASLVAAMPLGAPDFSVTRTLNTSSTGIFLPFTSSELIQENGKYYGVNAITQNIILIDRKTLKAPNGFVLGTPGSGKSFSVKREIVNVLLRDQKDEIIIIDPEREYSVLAENFEGEIVKIASDSKTHINPLDINDNYGDEVDPTILKSEFLISLCELILGGSIGLTSTKKTIIDRVSRHTYEIFAKKPTSPTLLDFYEVLKEQPEEEAQHLVIDLEMYIQGSLSVFSHQTNVNTDKKLVVYDIKDLGPQLKSLGMLVVLDQVWNRITLNRGKGVRTWLYIDEMQLLFANDYSANYFFELWSRARKWGAIPTGITQNVETLLLSDLARRMLSNSDFVMMLNQAKTDRSQLVRLFEVSEEQEKYIMNSDEGSGLLVFGETLLPFYDRFPKDTALYRMMTTKPDEVENPQGDTRNE